MDLRSYIRDVPDFPKKGIIFKDITPLWQDAKAFSYAIEAIAKKFQDTGVDLVAGVEARGFIIGSPVAHKLGVGFIPMRKPGKLPFKTTSISYQLEYGVDTIEMHEDAIFPGHKVLIVDDLLATGGTAAGMCELVSRVGGEVVGLAFIVELTFLDGQTKLSGYPIFSLIQF